MTAAAIIALIIELIKVSAPLVVAVSPLLWQLYRYMQAARAEKDDERRKNIAFEAIHFTEEYFAANPTLQKSKDAALAEARKYIQRKLPKETVATAEDLVHAVLPLAGLGAAAKKQREAARQISGLLNGQ